MNVDQFLVRFASTLGASILLVIALLAILFLKDRKIGRRFVLPVAALSLFLASRWLIDWYGEGSPVFQEAMRVAGLVFFAFALVRILATLIVDFFLSHRSGVETPRILRDMVGATLYAIAVISVLRLTVKIDLTSMLTTAGLLSIVLGLALQDTLGNVFSGLAIQIERPFSTGDWVSWNSGATIGRIYELGWRATTVVTRNEDLVIVPNSVLTKLELTNHTRPSRRHGRRQEIGLAYGTPPSLAFKVILDTLTTVPGVLHDPPPWIRIKTYADFSVVYLFGYFVADFMDAPDIEGRVSSALWYALRRAKIEIPFPVRHVYMHDVKQPEMSESLFADAERLLAEVDFLQPLDPPTRATLARRMHAMEFGTGEIVVRQGDAGETFFLVEGGEVGIRIKAEDGTQKEITTLGRGAYFGEMSLLTGEPRRATVTAKADTLLLTLDREGFRETLLANDAVARDLSEILARRSSEIEAAATEKYAPRESNRILGKLRELFKLGKDAPRGKVAADVAQGDGTDD